MAKIEQESGSNTFNQIVSGTVIKGEVISDNDIRFDGTLNGNLTTKGKIIIGATGVINGEINCKNSDIFGKVEGKIRVSELLSLKSTAKISGDIITNKLAIEPNAIFTGTCNMGGNSTPNAEFRKETEQKVSGQVK